MRPIAGTASQRLIRPGRHVPSASISSLSAAPCFSPGNLTYRRTHGVRQPISILVELCWLVRFDLHDQIGATTAGQQLIPVPVQPKRLAQQSLHPVSHHRSSHPTMNSQSKAVLTSAIWRGVHQQQARWFSDLVSVYRLILPRMRQPQAPRKRQSRRWGWG